MRTNERRALTSLEVLCATALAAMLMAAVTGFVATVAKHERTLRQRDPAPRWTRALASRLEDDFMLAHSITVNADGFQLEGPLGREPATGVATWRPARVTYRLAGTPLGPALLRAEGDGRSAAAGAETVCFGAERLALLPGAAGLDEARASPRRVYSGLPVGPPPASVRVVVTGGDARVIVDHVVNLY